MENNGIDTVIIRNLSRYRLPDFVENLVLEGLVSSGLGNSQNNNIYGNNRDNVLEDWDGNDLLYGRDGNDILRGGRGNDILHGDGGDDILIGYGFAVGEVEQLWGGTGRDRFILSPYLFQEGQTLPYANDSDAGYALILDFEASDDKIQLGGRRSDYRLEVRAFEGAGSSSQSDTLIRENGELIGVIADRSNVSLSSNAFIFTADTSFLL